MEKKSNVRTRNYASVVYPESAPKDWIDILEQLKIPCFISPLHDSDVNADGEIKKAHYHVMLMFDNVKTVDQAKAIFLQIGGVGCETVNSVRAYARYLCHLDNPDKFQYDTNLVKMFGGADYMTATGTMADKAKAIREMIQFINENDIICFADLLEFASINRSQWFDCLINSGSYVIKEFIKSRTWKIHQSIER